MSTPAQNANGDSTTSQQYPTLSEMGITRFSEISQYSMRQDGVDEDVLRIHYKRAKGSLLPSSRKYRFGRAVKSVVSDSATGLLSDVYEISPFLLKAVAELDNVVKAKRQVVDVKTQMLEELEELEVQVNRKIASLRKQMQSL